MFRRWHCCLAAALVCLLLNLSRTLPAGSPDPTTGLTLRETLEKGLKARRPVEFQYLAKISRMVDRKQLSENMVRATFGWARKRPGRPLQQFQFALYEIAKEQGVEVPRQ
ncbi:MAG: hypothetical protein AB7O62_01530 [Pirellulales bacterium]